MNYMYMFICGINICLLYIFIYLYKCIIIVNDIRLRKLRRIKAFKTS